MSQSTPNLTDIERHLMNEAFKFAYAALEVQEVPVGCIFTHNSQIIASGRNTVNETRNATRHAEMNCIDQVVDYCKKNSSKVDDVFREVEVFVTVEPCIMCIAALFDLKVKVIVYGCRNDRFGGCTVFDVGQVLKPFTKVIGGYRAEEAMELLKTFYKGTNPNAPKEKVEAKKKRLERKTCSD